MHVLIPLVIIGVVVVAVGYVMYRNKNKKPTVMPPPVQNPAPPPPVQNPGGKTF